MSNLGWYQKMTTASKRVGGPKNLIAIVAVGGYVCLRSLEAGTKKFVLKVKKNYEKMGDDCEGEVFVVENDITDEQGLTLYKGDEIRILANDGDAVLIEVIGADDNPYFVSEEFLREVF